jgi:hypothetical protein
MHLHRTIGIAKANGFSSTEIKDQILPKPFNHHVETEHPITLNLMVANPPKGSFRALERRPLIIPAHQHHRSAQ